MEYEWDEEKRRSNIEKHNVDILDALLMFESWVYTEEDSRFDYGEARFRSVGFADGICYVLIHTRRDGDVTRLISAWHGGRRDRRKYEEGYARRNSSDER